ncbi:serine/threonine-protein kinase [Dactylosporangium sp. CA-092794]|uniref:serine/threonine-protein kinase n=1 Tax=Dactylosporangium sp. CA-092794 TaxID=3239929 RepID=UPI003D8DFF61
MGDSPAPLRAGDPAVVGSYRLRGVLGVGGMGTVYLAVRPDGREVALKVINPELGGDPVFRERFAAEAAAASRVAGFCTARVLDVDLDGPVPHLVTEYVPGPSLHDYVTVHGPLDGHVAAVAVGVAAALAAIHAVGLVHADLSPRNVLLSPFGPKVIDFGVARRHGHAAASGPNFGTPGWLAPEQLAGAAPSQASDVYGWGLLVAWAGTGRMPSRAGDPADLAGLDESLAAVVHRALRADPAARPTAEQVLLALVGQRDPAAAQVAASVRDSGRARVSHPVPGVRRRGGPAGFAPGSAPVRAHAPATERFATSGTFGTGRATAGGSGTGGFAAGYGGGARGGTRADPAGGGWSVPLVPPPPPRRRPRRIGRGIATAVALVALLACLLGGLKLAESAGRGHAGAPAAGPSPTRSPSRSPSPSPKPSPVATDGKLKFTLAGFSCGVKEVGDWPLVRRPAGQFCLADLRVENTGGSAGRLWPGNQQLRDSGGTQYAADQWSWLYYSKTRPLVNDIGPGETATGTLVFDVPTGLTFTELRVKSGIVGGDGSTIRLR